MEKSKNKSLAFILVVYLAGIFMGAIDTGIVTPAREIIQNNFGVDAKTGIWMITIYTLAYAASIPVMGKLADRIGRKTIYILSIFLFGLGSLLCGLSHYFGSFWFLVGARALQAIGGGGIVPVATAEFGTSFPPEKRGMALGLVGAVYGVANIFGSLAGSAILDIFGTKNWEYILSSRTIKMRRQKRSTSPASSSSWQWSSRSCTASKTLISSTSQQR
jgi:MFS family permease